MKYCPLMSFQKQYTQETPCLGENCALASDEAGNCLNQQALQIFVGKERTRIAETEAARDHFKMLHKNGMRTPIVFTDMTTKTVDIDPIDWSNLDGGM